MLDSINPTDSAVWFIIYLAIGAIIMSEGLIREWASTGGSIGEVFDLNKAAPTLALGAVAGAIVFGIGGPVDPGLFEAVVAALIPILDNIRGIARAISSAVKSERAAGGDQTDQAIEAARAARDEFDGEAWAESRRRIEKGLEDADGPTPAAATNTSRELRERFDDDFSGSIPTAGEETNNNIDSEPEPEPMTNETEPDDNVPSAETQSIPSSVNPDAEPIGEAEDGARRDTNADADADAAAMTDNAGTPAPIGEAEDAEAGR